MKKWMKNNLSISMLKSHWSIVFFAVFIITLGLFFIYTENTKRSILRESRIEHQNLLELSEGYMHLLISNVNSDLHTLTDSEELNHFIMDTENLEYRSELGETIINRYSIHKEYKQIRFLNVNGLELFRYNNYGGAEIVSEEGLQDKAHREYFSESIELDENELYISKLDYNMEHGELVIPYEPIIRFALPVYIDGEIQGVVVVNYDGVSFLEYLEHFAVFYSDKTNISFIDNNSFWSSNHLHNGEFDFNVKDDENSWVFTEINDDPYRRNGEMYYKKVVDSPTNFTMVYPNGEDNYELMLSTSYNEIITQKGNFLVQFPIIKYVISLLVAILFVVVTRIIYSFTKLNMNSIITNFVTEFSSDAILITNQENMVTYSNHVFSLNFGYEETELLGQEPPHLFSTKYDSTDTSTGDTWSGVIWNVTKGGCFSLKNLYKRDIYSLNNNIAYTIRIYKDMQFDRLLDENLDTLAYEKSDTFSKMISDFLVTKISSFNRQVYFVLIKHSKRKESSDKEQSIKRDYNHKILEVVQESFEVVQTFIFDAQTIGLVHIVKDTDNSVEFMRKLENLQYALRETFNFKLNFAISLNDFVPNYTDLSFGSNSFIALQTSVRNSMEIVRYNNDIQTDYYKNQKMNEYLQKDFRENGLYVVYQSQRLTETREVVAAEALVRWMHPELGMLSPNEFLPRITELNKGRELTNFVIQSVIDDLLNNREKIELGFVVHINITVEDLEYSNMVNNVLKLIDESEVPNEMIAFEFVESVLAQDFRVMNSTLKEIKKQGHQLSLDDFGAGYSSLSYITKYDFDAIKIDKEFIINYPNQDTLILDISVQMSEQLNCHNVVEGVETMEQYKYVKKLGCKYYQGYLDSKPEPFGDMLQDYIQSKKTKD